MKLSKIEIPHLITKSITAPIPEYVIQQREAGRGTTLDYLSGATVIDILNNTFGHLGWSVEFTKEWVQESVPYFNKYSKEKEKVRYNGQEGNWENQNPIVFVKCRLTVHLERPDGQLYSVYKEAYGSKAVIGKQSEQDSTFKSAQTDALKKAASLFGIGLELYRGEEEQAYFNQISLPIIWTEEKRNSSENWAILEGIVKENSWSLDDLDYYVSLITENSYTDIYTLPEAWLDTLIEYLQQNMEEEDKGEE